MAAWLTTQCCGLRGFISCNKYQGVDYQPSLDNLDQAIKTIGYARKFNPVIDYLNSLTWDGTKRVDQLFGSYFNCGIDDYTRAVSIAFMVGAVRRMRKPGIKFDTVPILKSPRGGKSPVQSKCCSVSSGRQTRISATFTARTLPSSSVDFGCRSSPSWKV